VRERQEIDRAREDDPAFKALFDDEQSFLLDLDRREPQAASEALLAECRHNLMRAVYLDEMDRGSAPVARGLEAWWREITASFAAWRFAWQPAMMAALVGIGFFLGRVGNPVTAGVEQAALVSSPLGPADIQSVQVDPVAGNVRIVLEERKVVSGSADDPEIRRLLLHTVRESHSGARLASLEALRRGAEHQEVRRQLLRSMLEDENLGIRLKALDAVRVSSADPDVQRALVQAVMRDPNPGMRVQAIQVLTANPNRGMVGAFQHIIEQEQSPFVQQQVERVLQDLGASVEHH
jgi:hypothetical protein